MKSRKAKHGKSKIYIITAVISLLIVIAIISIVIYKNEVALPDVLTKDQANAPFKNENSKESNKETEGISTGTEKEGSSNNEANDPNENKLISADYIENQPLPTEPSYINGILVVNKRYPLPSTYNKGEDAVASNALELMLAAGKEAGYELTAFSGFRSFEYQTTLYNRYVNRDGKEAADRYSARPGYSEHQSGLAYDIGEKGKEDLWLTAEFGETPAGKWLMENAYKFGFILRYPEGKEHITGFMYESWHYRFVGVEHAENIYKQNVTLEEYLNIAK